MLKHIYSKAIYSKAIYSTNKKGKTTCTPPLNQLEV